MRVDASWQQIWARLREVAWAPQCVLCGQTGRAPQRDLCTGCEEDLPSNGRCCSVCAEPLQAADDVSCDLEQELICGACLQRRPRFDACLAPFRYAYPVDHMIRALKYGGGIAHGRVLGELFAAGCEAIDRAELPQLLLPVPLGTARFIQRGYNQAILLAEHISRRLAIPLSTDLLVRTRETLEQAGLDRKARRENLRSAFALRLPLPAMHVAIVDDVITTGSTANEVARVLKRAGARQVDVWAIARASRSHRGRYFEARGQA